MLMRSLLAYLRFMIQLGLGRTGSSAALFNWTRTAYVLTVSSARFSRRWAGLLRAGSRQLNRGPRKIGPFNSWAWAGLKDKEVIRKAARAILGEQRPDGGWAQASSLATDAYATGEALAALRESGNLAVPDAGFNRRNPIPFGYTPT